MHYWSTNINLLRQHWKLCGHPETMHRRQHIQFSFETGDIQGMYEESHWLNQIQDSTAEFLDQQDYQGHKQMERGMEHYLELYAKESRILDDTLDIVACLSVIEKQGS